MSRSHTPRSQRAWRALRAFYRNTLVAAISISSILLLACLLADVSVFLKGREVDQHIWYIISENSLLGIGFWAITFPLASGGLLYFIKRKLSRNSSLPYWLGGSLALVCYCALGLLIFFASRRDIPVCSFVVHLIKVLIT